MAININAPKNILLMPFFILLVIIAIPFALFFSLIRLPFANRRINKLPEILKNDWMPRKKYIYIGINSNFALSDFVKEKIISKYGKYIIWDEWNDTQNEWNNSEPDSSNRITTFWQDIGGDFDGDPLVIIATYKPDDFVVKHGKDNFHQFILNGEDSSTIYYNAKKITFTEAEAKIQNIIEQSLVNWR